jgi:hypothetical protein
VQQKSRTDDSAGGLIGKLINKRETDGNKQIQQKILKEIQPVIKAGKAGGLVRLLVLLGC